MAAQPNLPKFREEEEDQQYYDSDAEGTSDSQACCCGTCRSGRDCDRYRPPFNGESEAANLIDFILKNPIFVRKPFLNSSTLTTGCLAPPASGTGAFVSFGIRVLWAAVSALTFAGVILHMRLFRATNPA